MKFTQNTIILVLDTKRTDAYFDFTMMLLFILFLCLITLLLFFF